MPHASPDVTAAGVTMRVPLVDLGAQHAQIADEVMPKVSDLVRTQSFILGEPVAAFERALAAHAGAAYAVGVASGSDALALALGALGIGAGDAVLTTAFTFVATAEAIVRCGARPIFCDIDRETLTLSPDSVRAAIARSAGKFRAAAILPVHLFGRAADMDALSLVARDHGLALVEDAAQAIGARLGDRRVGSMGDAGCFSFFPSKNLGAWGDGGAVVTSSAPIAARVTSLRSHGVGEDGAYEVTGSNSRLDALQAVVLGVKLAHLEAWTRARIAAAARYHELLEPLGEDFALPAPALEGAHVYNQFVVRTPRRADLAAFLAAHGVASRAYYARPLHREPCFAGLDEAELPHTDEASETTLAIPIYAEITEEQQAHVASTIAAFFRRQPTVSARP